MPEPRRFRALLSAALAVTHREVPAFHARMADALGPRVVRVVVEGEPLLLRARGGRVEKAPPDAEPDLEGSSTPDAIDAILAGRTTPEEAVFEGSVRLRGRISDLVAADEALKLFVQAAVRSPGVGPIFDEWKRARGSHHV